MAGRYELQDFLETYMFKLLAVLKMGNSEAQEAALDAIAAAVKVAAPHSSPELHWSSQSWGAAWQ